MAKVNEQELEFKALTIMDTTTNLLEIVRIDNKTSRNITQMFTNNWLASTGKKHAVYRVKSS